MRAEIIVGLVFVASVFGQGNLYLLSTVWYDPSATTPATLLQVDVTGNSTTELMNWNFSNQTYVVGTAFDKYNMIYYFVHNQQSGFREQSFISAINVQTKEFVISEVEIAPGKLVIWDIDIDSSGKIHYLARTSMPHGSDSRSIVDYCVWDPTYQKSVVIESAVTTLPNFGSVSYDEAKETLLVIDSYSILTTIGKGRYLTAFPKSDDIISQGSIEFNNATNIAYMSQWENNAKVEIHQFVEFTNQYPKVCQITIDSTSWSAVSSISDASALNPTNNFYSFVINEAVGNEHPNEVDAIVTVDLDTCQQYWVYYSHAKEVEIGGPEYAFAV